MNIRTRDLDAKLRSLRLAAPAALVGIALLYAAILVPAIESKPFMAVCITVVMVSLVSQLLHWHAWRVERRVLAELAQQDAALA